MGEYGLRCPEKALWSGTGPEKARWSGTGPEKALWSGQPRNNTMSIQTREWTQL